MRAFTTVLVAGSLVMTVFGGVALAQEQKSKTLQLKDLPPSVQKAVQDNLKGSAINTIGKEQEDGIEHYEIETTVNGKARDFNVALDGRLLVVDEATTIDAIPAAAKAAILKKVGGGTVKRSRRSRDRGQSLV